MEKEKLAVELVRAVLKESKKGIVQCEIGVREKATDNHYLVTVSNHEPTSKIERLTESVLYPAATKVCERCGK